VLTDRQRTVLVLATVATLTLSACSGAAATPRPAASSSTAAPAATTPDAAASTDAGATDQAADGGTACAIVTNDAVGAAAGFTVTRAAGAGGICMFQNADSSKYLAVTLFGTQADMATMLQIEPGSSHIAGLGDDAFWVPSAGLLFVRQGDHAMELLDPDLGTAGTDTTSRDALVTLARTALPRL
jgi:hypothetical protein